MGSLGETLGKAKKLETLSLKGNPVAEVRYYREWLVWKCKKLRSLDFDRIKEKVGHYSAAFLVIMAHLYFLPILGSNLG